MNEWKVYFNDKSGTKIYFDTPKSNSECLNLETNHDCDMPFVPRVGEKVTYSYQGGKEIIKTVRNVTYDLFHRSAEVTLK